MQNILNYNLVFFFFKSSRPMISCRTHDQMIGGISGLNISGNSSIVTRKGHGRKERAQLDLISYFEMRFHNFFGYMAEDMVVYKYWS